MPEPADLFVDDELLDHEPLGDELFGDELPHDGHDDPGTFGIRNVMKISSVYYNMIGIERIFLLLDQGVTLIFLSLTYSYSEIFPEK